MLVGMESTLGADASVEYVGPFESYRVVVNGWQVPLLAADLRPGGIVSLTLDDRYGLDVPVADADRVVSFIAHAIAIGLGYASHPGAGAEEPKQLAPLRPKRLLGLEFQAEEASG
jgi:hypothetical protein